MTRLGPFRIVRLLCTLAAFIGLAEIAMPVWAQFETRATKAVPGEAFSVVAGDFNGDGKLDIAIMDGQVSILLGNGDGTFQSPVNYPSAPGVWIAVADFNHDGKLDLVTANGDNSVSVFLGKRGWYVSIAENL